MLSQTKGNRSSHASRLHNFRAQIPQVRPLLFQLHVLLLLDLRLFERIVSLQVYVGSVD